MVSDETISRLGPWSFDKEEFSFLKRFQEMSMVLVWFKKTFLNPPKKYDVLIIMLEVSENGGYL